MTSCAPSLCSTWIPERDEEFFRIVQGLFCADFLAGAEVLLASHDDDADLVTDGVVPTQRGDLTPRATSGPAGQSHRAAP